MSLSRWRYTHGSSLSSPRIRASLGSVRLLCRSLTRARSISFCQPPHGPIPLLTTPPSPHGLLRFFSTPLAFSPPPFPSPVKPFFFPPYLQRYIVLFHTIFQGCIRSLVVVVRAFRCFLLPVNPPPFVPFSPLARRYVNDRCVALPSSLVVFSLIYCLFNPMLFSFLFFLFFWSEASSLFVLFKRHLGTEFSVSSLLYAPARKNSSFL